jgi:hypothetical protein
MSFINSIFFRSLNAINDTKIGDHFFLDWDAHYGWGWNVFQNIKVWDEIGTFFSRSIRVLPIMIDVDTEIEIIRRDVLVDEMGLNDTDLIIHPFSPGKDRYSDPKKDILWSHLNDTIFFMNRSDAERLGYNIINISYIELDPPFGRHSPFYYHSYLDFSCNGTGVSLMEGEVGNLSIEGYTYRLTVIDLFRWTTLSSYNYSIDAHPGAFRQFMVERTNK